MEEKAQKYFKKETKKIEDLTDRELMENISKQLYKNNSLLSPISTWIQIWSWISVISLAFWIFYLISENKI